MSIACGTLINLAREVQTFAIFHPESIYALCASVLIGALDTREGSSRVWVAADTRRLVPGEVAG